MSGPSFARCEQCATAVFPARPLCPACGSRSLRAERSSGRGVVYSTTTVHRREEAHNVALVDLEEGFRMMSEVAGIAPDGVRIGMAVRARDDDGRIVFDVA